MLVELSIFFLNENQLVGRDNIAFKSLNSFYHVGRVVYFFLNENQLVERDNIAFKEI